MWGYMQLFNIFVVTSLDLHAARHEAWFLYDFIGFHYKDLPVIAQTHLGIDHCRYQAIIDNHKVDNLEQRYQLMIEWKHKSRLSE